MKHDELLQHSHVDPLSKNPERKNLCGDDSTGCRQQAVIFVDMAASDGRSSCGDPLPSDHAQDSSDTSDDETWYECSENFASDAAVDCYYAPEPPDVLSSQVILVPAAASTLTPQQSAYLEALPLSLASILRKYLQVSVGE